MKSFSIGNARMGLFHNKSKAKDWSKISEFQVIKNLESDKVIALAGNPNVGKSTLFNNLTKLHQHTGNWPGKTVTCTQGNCRYKNTNYIFVDLPGTYSLMAHSEEEEVARDFICQGSADATVVVCDATSLERNLNLVLQILKLTKQVIVCVNLCDEAAKKGIAVDFNLLSTLLEVPVVSTCAAKGKGFDQLLLTIEQVLSNENTTHNDKPVIHEDPVFEPSQPPMEVCSYENPLDDDEEQVTAIILQAEEIAKKVVHVTNINYRNRDSRIDRVLTGPITSIPIMLILLVTIFWLTITGANYPSQLLSKGLFALQDQLLILASSLGVSEWLQGALILGVYRVLAWVISVMLPPMAIFFPLFTLMEDLGYLPRVAFNLDRCFKKCCACGKQALTMCMARRYLLF